MIALMSEVPRISAGPGPALYDHQLTEASPFWVSAMAHPVPTGRDLHVHAGLEIGVILAGGQEISFDEMVLSTRPGDVWLCAMWEPHGWRITEPRTENAVLVFLPDFLGEEMLDGVPWLSLFAVPPAQRPRASTPQMRQEALAIGRHLWREVHERGPAWETALRLYTLLLLVMLRRGWEQPAASGRQARLRVSNVARIMPALTLVHSDPAHRLGVSDAAAACALSRSHFDAIFRHTMGISFGRFRERARLTFAAHLLLTTERSVESIAAEAHFVDGSHLHRRFRKRYGWTPTEYRKRVQLGRSRP